MARTKRPTAVTVMAILNIVFGAIGLIVLLCLGILILGGVALLTSASQGMKPEDKQLFQDMYDVFTRNVPGLIPFFVITTVIGVIMAVILLSAGIGLLGMKRWARTASIGYAIVTIVLQIATFGYQTAVLNPGMEKATKELERVVAERQRGGPGFQQQPQNPLAQAVGSVFGAVIGMAYAIALLIVMYQPKVVAAFARQGSLEGEGEYEEGDDWGYRRGDADDDDGDDDRER